MSNGEENGGGQQPPPDDRTLLDPLSNEELRALREARQRMQAKKAAGKSSAIKHQIVITPESTEADRPRRDPSAAPALPSFDGDVTLDQIRVPPRALEQPAPAASPSPDAPTQPAGAPPEPRTEPTTDPAGGSEPPRAGATGFGENTLLWMQPVKPTGAASTAPTANDAMFQSSPREKTQRILRGAVLAVVALLVVGLVAFLLSGSERGVLELVTHPPRAKLYVNGTLRDEPTPVKLTLPAGAYTLRVEKEGYEPEEIRIDVSGDLDARKTVDLRPQSQPGLQTVTVEVEPIAANVTVDGKEHTGVQTLHVPNLDPNTEHRIRVEAGGFIKTEQVIRPGELQSTYRFTLERDESE